MTSVIREALDGVASAAMRERIIERALFVASLPTVPEPGAALREFVTLFLQPAIAATLSDEDAEHVAMHLEPILRLAEADDAVSDIHPSSAVLERVTRTPPARTRSDAPTQAPPPEPDGDASIPSVPRAASVPNGLFGATSSGVQPASDLAWDSQAPESATRPAPGALPVVLVASQQRDVSNAIRRALRDQVIVRHVTDSMALLDALQSPEQLAQLLFVDGRHPAIEPATLASMSDEVPEQSLVVLWDVRRDGPLAALVDSRAEWLVCDEEELDDIASVCADLLGI